MMKWLLKAAILLSIFTIIGLVLVFIGNLYVSEYGPQVVYWNSDGHNIPKTSRPPIEPSYSLGPVLVLYGEFILLCVSISAIILCTIFVYRGYKKAKKQNQSHKV